MTIYFTVFLMTLVAAAVILLPLWRRQADVSPGMGLEGAEVASRWVDEKDRIAAQMSELDVARAEGKIDQDVYEAEREKLAIEGERVLKGLQRARASERSTSAKRVARAYPALGSLVGVCFIIATTALTVALGNKVLSRNVSPHADGTIPLPPSEEQASGAAAQTGGRGAAAGPPVIGADGQPDIGAMVARLEERVAKPNATLNDIMMLARSFLVLGRDDEAIALYERALALAPEDPRVLVTSSQALAQSDDETAREKSERLVDKVLAQRPDYPEAMWLKSLGLLRRHRMAEATSLLRRLAPLVKGNPEAKKAVADLLDRLETTEPAQLSKPNNQ